PTSGTTPSRVTSAVCVANSRTTPTVPATSKRSSASVTACPPSAKVKRCMTEWSGDADDGKVMTLTRMNVTVHNMSIADPITVLVLQEFRLRAADDAAAAARIVAASPSGLEPAIPLLTSIEDGRDVATLRALRAGETTEIDEG